MSRCQPNVNMADAAAARREARRKRILENSHNRLQLISGKCNDDCPRESPVRTIIPEPIEEISISSGHIISDCINTPVNNGIILSESDTFDFLTFNHDIANRDIAAGDAELPDFTPFMLPPQDPLIVSQPQTSSFLEKLTNYRYDIVLLSIVIQLVYSLSLVSFEGTYFFSLILIYSVTKMIWFPSQSNSKISSALMLLQGISSYRVQKIIYLSQCFTVLLCDVCIFLFTTICIQFLLITLNNALNT